MRIEVEFGPDAARDLAAGLRVVRQHFEKQGKRRPRAVIEIEEVAEAIWKAGKTGQIRVYPGDDLPNAAESGKVPGDGALVTQTAAARALGVNVRTLRGWIDKGELPSVGPSRRVPREAINRLLRCGTGAEREDRASGPR